MKTFKILHCFLLFLFSLSLAPLGNSYDAPMNQEQIYEAIIGEWEMETEFQGSIIPAVMTLSVKDGKLEGVWVSMDQEMELIDLRFDGDKLSFKRTMGVGGTTIEFEGTVKGDEISGKYLSPMGGEYECRGKRKTTK